MSDPRHIQTVAGEAAGVTALEDWRLQLAASRRRPVRIWLWSIALLTLLVLVIGGITRLTHSGLSMVDWEPLVGVVPPLGEQQWAETFDRYRQFPEYQKLRRGMTLGEFKFIFFWEYLHRLSARAIGVAFSIPFLIFWLRGYLTRPLAVRVLVLFALGAMQGVMGWLMVRSGLVDIPSVSHYRLAAHLALAFVIFGYSIWLARDLSVGRPGSTPRHGAARLIRRGLTIVGVLLAAQVVWGAFVAGLKAGLIFNTVPLMDGGVMPPRVSDVEGGLLFALLQHPAGVQWMHRLLGTVLLGSVLWLFLMVRRGGVDPLSSRLNTALMATVGVQYVLGVLTLLYVVPISLAVPHQALAMVVFGVWVIWVHHMQFLHSSDGSNCSATPLMQ